MEVPELLVADTAEWRTWLNAEHATSPGVWLVLAKKGTSAPTALTYDDALLEAICFGWIDGQLKGRDASTFRRRFTPRSPRSLWSKRNVALAEALADSGRMQTAGDDEVRRAREDGRWEAAYSGQADAEVPDDLAEALAANPRASEKFATLTGANRYAIHYRVTTAKRAETRAKRIQQLVDMLARGETIHPQRPR